MPRVRTTVTLDEEVLRAVKLRAARSGKRDSDVIEEALRSELSIDLFAKIWENAMMDPDEAMELALEAQQEAREELRRERKASA
jgi:hypothetical protein